MTDSGPLGKYGPAAALVASLGVLGVWLLLIVLQSLGIGTGPSTSLDTFAILAIGVLIGNTVAHTQATVIASQNLNGQVAAIKALHTRLDAMGAPPAATPIDPKYAPDPTK